MREQLQNAIVPKFKIGQRVFVSMMCRLPDAAGTICAVHYDSNELHNLKVTYNVKVQDRLYESVPESCIFAPRGETEKALAERGAK